MYSPRSLERYLSSSEKGLKNHHRPTKLPAPSWPDSSTGRALHPASQRSGFECLSGLSRHYLSSAPNCEDHKLKFRFNPQFKCMTFMYSHYIYEYIKKEYYEFFFGLFCLSVSCTNLGISARLLGSTPSPLKSLASPPFNHEKKITEVEIFKHYSTTYSKMTAFVCRLRSH